MGYPKTKMAGRTNPERGFTLIELIVVIAIIAVVAAVVLSAFSSSQRKSRDSKRRQDVRQIGTALVNYGANNKSIYPVRVTEVNINTVTELTVQGFLSQFPPPPVNATDPYTYISTSPTADRFGVCTDLEARSGKMLRFSRSGMVEIDSGVCTPGD